MYVRPLVLIADLLLLTGRRELSGRVSRAALKLGPRDVRALTAVAWMSGAEGAQGEAEEYIGRALVLAPDDLRVRVVAGQVAAAAGRWEEAGTHYRAVLAGRLPATVRYRTRLALSAVSLRMGRFEEALEYATQAIESRPAQPDGYLAMAATEEARDRMQAAEEHYREALARKDDLPETWARVGALCLAREDFPAAKEAFAHALSLRDATAEAHCGLAQVLADEGDYAGTLEHAARAVALEPRVAWYAAWMGRAHELSGHEQEVERWYRRAAELDPMWSWAWSRLGLLHLERGEYEKAQPAFLRALEVEEKNAEAHDGLAQALVEQDQAAEALPHALKAAELEPGNPWYVGHVGYLHDVLGEGDEAEQWYQRAADLDPLWTWPLVKLGWLRLSEGEAEAAGDFFKHALALDAQDGFAYQGLAEAWELRQDYEQALDYANRAVEAAPGEADCQMTLGRVLTSLRRWPEAELAFREASALAPKWVEAHTRLAESLATQGRLEEAETECRQALELDANDPVAWCGLGYCREVAGDYPAAEEAYRKGLELAPDWEWPAALLTRLLLFLERPEEAHKAAAQLDPEVELPELFAALSAARGEARGAWSAVIQAEGMQLSRGEVDLFLLGFAFEKLGDTEAAERWYREAAESGDKLAEARLARGLPGAEG